MIEDALVFALGALAAGLLALVLFPAFTRRAARLARREAEERLPRTLAEITAGKDAIRAEYAVKTARVEADLAAVRKALIDERLARAEEQTDLFALRSEKRAFGTSVEDAERRVAEARAELRSREEALNQAAADRRDLERRIAVETERGREAQARAEEAARLATEIRVALVAAEARTAALADALRATQFEQEALEQRLIEVEEALGRRTAELAAASEGHGNRAALEGAMEDLLAERRRLLAEATVLRRERDRARAAAAGIEAVAAGDRAGFDAAEAGSDAEALIARGRSRAAPKIAAGSADDGGAGRREPMVAVDAPTSQPAPLHVPVVATIADGTLPAVAADPADEPAAVYSFPSLAVPSMTVSEVAVDPDEQARRVDDLARRLRQLRVRNAASRTRPEGSTDAATDAPLEGLVKGPSARPAE